MQEKEQLFYKFQCKGSIYKLISQVYNNNLRYLVICNRRIMYKSINLNSCKSWLFLNISNEMNRLFNDEPIH